MLLTQNNSENGQDTNTKSKSVHTNDDMCLQHSTTSKTTIKRSSQQVCVQSHLPEHYTSRSRKVILVVHIQTRENGNDTEQRKGQYY